MKKKIRNIPAREKKTLFQKIGQLIDGIDEIVYDTGGILLSLPIGLRVILESINYDISVLRNVYHPNSAEFVGVANGIDELNNQFS